MKNKLRVGSLFSGIGAFEKGLSNLGVDYDLKFFSEIDKCAIKSYCQIHNISEEFNLGDISKVNASQIPDIDLMTYGFPCQDISKNGALKGFEKDSKTRSSLLWEAMRIAECKKPKYMIAENVKNLVSKRFRDDFEKWLEYLDDLGYNNYWQILNSKKFGVPQNRERVFIVSIRKDVDEGFQFPQGIDTEITLDSLLEDNVDDSYYLTQEYIDQFIELITDDTTKQTALKVREATKKGYAIAELGDSINIQFPNSKTRRGRVQKKSAGTLETACNQAILTADGKIRKLTPKESWLLMGFEGSDMEKCRNIGTSKTQLYKQAGNSIVVNVLEAIFKELLK